MGRPREHSISEMVEHVEWFVPTHYDILEFFDNHRIIINAADLARNIGRDDDNTRKRCKDLRDVDLLKQIGRSWTLTDTGVAYLEGDVDPSTLQCDDSSR